MVEWADLVIAECSYPSIGVGIELQVAEQNGIPIIIFFDTEKKSVPQVEYANPDGSKHWLQIGEGHVTLMALGLPNVLGVISYSGKADAIEQISRMMDRVQDKSL
jgi:hypothetical protein